jgi:hypothetical protein
LALSLREFADDRIDRGVYPSLKRADCVRKADGVPDHRLAQNDRNPECVIYSISSCLEIIQRFSGSPELIPHAMTRSIS